MEKKSKGPVRSPLGYVVHVTQRFPFLFLQSNNTDNKKQKKKKTLNKKRTKN